MDEAVPSSYERAPQERRGYGNFGPSFGFLTIETWNYIPSLIGQLLECKLHPEKDLRGDLINTVEIHELNIDHQVH